MVLEVYKQFTNWFWNEDFWLPPNITWADLTANDKVQYAQFNDLYIPIGLGLVFLVIRHYFERIVLTPCGLKYGLRLPRGKKPPNNNVLEKAFKANGRTGYKQVQGLAKQLDWTERQVERWFRQRKLQETPPIVKRFTESGWRFTFYLSALIYGIVCLWDKPWTWDANRCWDDFPHQSVSPGIWWYYMLEMSFYWSLLYSQFTDIKRKDFWEMFIHHIITLTLLSFSWACNLFRIGSLVLVLHDMADIPMEAAKMFKYLNKQRVADIMFALFTVVWFITRVGIFPYKIIYNTMFEAPTLVPMFQAYYFFNGLLCFLLVLHVIWSYMILMIAANSLAAGKFEKDIRSETEASSETGQVEN